MFRKLRNRLIWINLGVTTVVIVTAFAAIYLFATGSANKRPPMNEGGGFFSSEIENLIQQSIEQEKQAAARDLLITLVVSGITIEIIVALISFYLAEESIKPVREAYEAQKVFIANASHEIKTPLAAIAANLEAADIHGNKWIANVEKETTKLTALNAELLTLARADLVTESVAEDVDAAKALNEVIEIHNPRLKNLNLKKKIMSGKKVRINRGDFVQIANIMLDNAIKYADSKIIITLDENILTIKNDGATIAEKDLPHVFERFYQADKSAEGVGLGLAIAKSVAERNGWDLTAESDEKWTAFCLKF